ncbi:hypothetical protein A4X13_0g5295 [Tilletia indica]|uniref:Zinc finger PHD-type domain-containing protein n=1 Tax=Tilletia indica TaxID=43049 RepID=A0A177TP49_9BASI|nr:hypothetical protein A4X13_0g5295 [Tilletia indica]
MERNVIVCFQQIQGSEAVPRKAGFAGRVGGTQSFDYTNTTFWLGDVAGIHLPDDLPEECERHRSVPPGVLEWNDPNKWCMCQGLGRKLFGKEHQWIECSSGKDCSIRWFHAKCVQNAIRPGDYEDQDLEDQDEEDDWTCMFCRLLAQENKNKRRRLTGPLRQRLSPKRDVMI